jgi:hypothetical protein
MNSQHIEEDVSAVWDDDRFALQRSPLGGRHDDIFGGIDHLWYTLNDGIHPERLVDDRLSSDKLII